MPSEWFALENAEDSVDDAKNLLSPFNGYTWAKIAVIVFFIGGTVSTAPTFSPDGIDVGPEAENVEQSQIWDDLQPVFDDPDNYLSSSALFLIGIAFSVLILIGTYLSGVFRFIYFQNLHDNRSVDVAEIKIIDNFAEHAVNGLKYLLVYSAGVMFALLVAASIIGSFLLNPFAGVFTSIISIPLWIIIVLLFFFMRGFLIPEMAFNRDQSVMESINNVYDLVLNQWQQSGIFVIVKTALDIVVSIIWTVAFISGLVLIAIPLLLLGAAMYTVSPILVLIPVIIGLTSVLVLHYLIQVPLQTFIFYYVLNVYEDFVEGEREN